MYDGKTSFVAHITLVKGVPFYGYRVGYEPFLKIYMLNPLHMTRLADLLRQGTIMKKVIQPYESHMQYLAQWMCDYNLYGCAYIDCSEVRFRNPIPDFLEMSSTRHQWHNRTVDPALISDEVELPRQSHCSIEVDVSLQHILNRHDVKPRPIHQDFIERGNPMAPDEKLVPSMASLWQDETKRRKARLGDLDPGSSPFPPEVLISVSADPRNSQPGGWIHEQEYMDKINGIVLEEKDKSDGEPVNPDGNAIDVDLGGIVQTVIESVEDLFPNNTANLAASRRSSQAGADCKTSLAVQIPQVDEARLLSFEEDDFAYRSDEELARELDISQRQRADRRDDSVEQVTNDITNVPIFNDTEQIENDRERRQNTNCSLGPGKTVSPGYAQAYSSSNELKAMGIRHAGDYNHVDEDAFDIPIDFTGNISGRLPDKTLSVRPLLKKRKLAHDDCTTSNSISIGFVQGSAPKSEETIPSSAKPPEDSHPANSPGREKPSIIVKAPQQPEGRPKVHHASASQESDHRVLANRTLSFPVVKDPQNPYTIRKLSQNSYSPTRDSHGSKGTSVTFAHSSGLNSEASSEPKGASLSLAQPPETFSEVIRCASQVHQHLGLGGTERLWCFRQDPPPSSDLLPQLRKARRPSTIYQDAYYGKEKDIPERPREYAGKEFRIGSNSVPFLPDFDPNGASLASLGEEPGIVIDRQAEERALQRRQQRCGFRTWEFEELPPSQVEVSTWLEEHEAQRTGDIAGIVDYGSAHTNNDLSQIDGPTQKNHYGFKYSQKRKSTSVKHETQYMSIMSLEIHVNTRGNLVPNPEQDEIACIFWSLQSEDEEMEVNGINEGTHVGILALSEEGGLAHRISQHTAAEIEEEMTELDLINRMIDIVRGYDPDILTGYEVHNGSWGYIIERARCKYDYNLCDEFSRMKSQSHGRFAKEDDRWGFNHTSTIRVTGRHMINIWRAMRGELNLLQYTMENVVFQLCHRRIPHYSFSDLSSWYTSGKAKDLAKVIDYFVSRVQLDLEILEQNELVPRISEQARLLGVDFFSVFSRGSQFKVESLMFRIAKPENFLLPSPSRKQVGQQNALECLPLVMEPQSAFYNSPLLVLDFQSLYPSVMIAYNYCYSTFLGRVVSWRGQNKMGFTDYHRKPRLLELLKDQTNIAPNGMMYAKPEVRKSLLAKMLGEILETRVMVKSGMKVDKDDRTLQRLLNNRQLALKLIANVTYGYTSASFSGRMPCSEIADSIVQTGRETLEKAIALIHSVERWGAEVVYGDTDSLFVYLSGRTRDEAFDIGQEIATTITKMNPRPVKLKFEKVYHPCVLLAKKRYVGFKYESKAQTEPEFDAKGIETVRRDGTPAEQRIEEKALKILFRSADLSQVKDYFQRQCTKIMKGRVSIQDFCFAKEVKLGTYSDKGLPPPGALISTRRMLQDPRTEPQYGERVPYVVITGAPGARLTDRCVIPDVLLHNDNNELDAEYYISKNLIPPLERIFNLVGANVRQWYDEMPKFQRIRRIEAGTLPGGREMNEKKTLESYMKSSACLVCREKLEEEAAVCSRCMQQVDTSLLSLRTRINGAEEKAVKLEKVCRSCAGLAWGEEVRCDSRDCPVFYTRTRHMAGLRSTSFVTQRVIELLERAGANGLDW